MPTPRFSLRSPLAALVTTALVTTTAAVVLVAAPQSASAASRAQVLSSAYAYGRARGYHVGIAVLDTKTGKTYHAGYHSGTFASESVVKVMIAARVFAQGRLHGTTAKRVYYMITHSDDSTASSLYPSVGGDHLINWVKSRYHVSNLGSPPNRPGWWGNTHITPDGMVALYGKLKATRTFGAWLINAMAHASKYGSDGFYQWFGLKSANSHAAIKQGWGSDGDNWSAEADENTTGFVNGNRYAVAILARGPATTYGKAIGSMLTGTAKRLLPGGVFPADAPVVTSTTGRHSRLVGGHAFVLRGRNLAGAYRVWFGSTWVRPSRVTDTSLHVTSPRHAVGTVHLRVTTPAGTSSASGPWFRYVALPSALTLTPASGKAGTLVTVRGVHFEGPSAFRVLLGHTWVVAHATSSRRMTFRVPAGTGTVKVQPSTIYGTATTGPTFTYDVTPTLKQRSVDHPTVPSSTPTASAPSSSTPAPPSTTSAASTTGSTSP
ncbi:IPT/TIG domain-containing protein [uncultured Jatrophihabitans sp.]|uniref:IPT/TIG domain-containing protein n=1 Tax=uncultured Jatrophihabitans sp. TaxID=1610747 RepID=UPI0035CBA3DA